MKLRVFEKFLQFNKKCMKLRKFYKKGKSWIEKQERKPFNIKLNGMVMTSNSQLGSPIKMLKIAKISLMNLI